MNSTMYLAVKPLIRAACASLLLAVPVVAEAVHLIGDQAWGEILFAATQLAGWALVATLCVELASAPGSGRWGPRLVLGGVAAQGLFAAVYLVTFLATGQPFGAVFVLFLLGFLALTVGGLVWARSLRRTPARSAAVGLAAVAVLGFLAIMLATDPFHDIALAGSYLAWTLVGRGIPARSVVAGERVSVASR